MSKDANFWQQVRKTYEQEKKNYQTLAEEFGISVGAITYHAKKEGWKRKTACRGISKNQLQEVAGKLSRAAVREIERMEEQETDVKTIRDLTVLVKELGQLMRNMESEQTEEGVVVEWSEDTEVWSR